MTAPFTYYPVYGIEPFDNVTDADLTTGFGGGAKLTGSNLLTTLWDVTGTDGSGRFISDALMQPSYASIPALHPTGIPPFADLASNVAAGLPFSSSRTSCKFGLYVTDPDAFAEGLLIAVLNPPGELRNYYMNSALKALAVADAYGFEFFTRGSFFDLLVWDARFVDDHNATLPVLSAVFGSIGGTGLMASSGADGEFPSYFTSYLEAAADAARVPSFMAGLREIAKGNFFIPTLITMNLDEETSFAATFTWPHSLVR